MSCHCLAWAHLIFILSSKSLLVLFADDFTRNDLYPLAHVVRGDQYMRFESFDSIDAMFEAQAKNEKTAEADILPWQSKEAIGKYPICVIDGSLVQFVKSVHFHFQVWYLFHLLISRCWYSTKKKGAEPKLLY